MRKTLNILLITELQMIFDTDLGLIRNPIQSEYELMCQGIKYLAD